MSRLVPLFLAGAICTAPVVAESVSVLFVGNSYTFGRVDPVMSYNAANVDDMTRPLPEHGQRRLGPARQCRQAQVGCRRGAGAKRRRSSGRTRCQRELSPVQRAVDEGIAKGGGSYGADGTYAATVPQDKIKLWWHDYLHASKCEASRRCFSTS